MMFSMCSSRRKRAARTLIREDGFTLIELLVVLIIIGLLAAIGSFVNVLAYRLPRRESIVKPRSRCPRCETQIAGYDNVPVVSWLVLRGHCRHCRTRIPVRYPLVEALTALLFVGVGLKIG